jgi:hypothetical protein
MAENKPYKLVFETTNSATLSFELDSNKELIVENKFGGVCCQYIFSPEDIAVLVACITQNHTFEIDVNIKPSQN